MSKDEEKKSRSRWVKGNTRYDKPTLEAIDNRYREQPGWRNGCRVYKKT